MGDGLLRASQVFSKLFNNKWLIVLLMFVIAAGCKKVTEEPGIISPCPVVVSTDPMDKAVNVALNKVISVTFNTDMNPETINGNSFTIKLGTQIITGTVAATTSGTTFTFTPEVALLPFRTYTGTITTAATDKFRTAMVSNYVWTFTTIPLVTLSANPVAGGTVTGAGTFAQGSSVTVSAVPKTGYTFTNFTDSGTTTVASTSPNYTFTMAGNRALVANFALIPPAKFAVMVSSNPAAGGSTFGSGSYDVGSTVTVIASPNQGFTFVNFTENGTVVSTNSSFQFVITANRTFVANFTAIPALQFTVIATPNPSIGGTTTGSGSYTIGASATVTATPNSGYSFVNFTENGTVVSTSSSFTFTVNGNRTLVANFAINTFTVTATANPAAGGTVTKSPNQATHNSGSLVTLTATPNPGYTFVNFTEGTTVVSTNSSYSFNVTANRVLVANFTIKAFTLTVTSNPTNGGTVTKNPNQAAYDSASTVQLTATPNAGFTFTSWSGDASGSSNPLSVVMNSNKTIVANFTAIPLPPPPSAVNLGSAAAFGSFGGNAGITNQGINTVINNGSIGTTAASTLITGFHDNTGDSYTETPLNIGDVKGRIYTAPPPPVIFGPGGPFGGTAATKAIADQGLLDAQAAYNSISPASKPGGTDPGAGELGGLTLPPGVYKSAGATFQITNGNLTLNAQGDPNAVWIFQTAAGLTVGVAGPSGARSVLLINGAQAKNVFWYVGSAAVINAAGGGVMTGTIISTSGITFSTAGNAVQTVLNGRALSLVASVTMVNTTINVPN